MLQIFLIILAFVPCVLQADEEIVVQVGTENALTPITLSSFKDDKSGFENGYLKKLEDVFRFDMNHNGMSVLSQNGVYTIEVTVHNKMLDAIVTSKTGKEGTQVRNLLLSGNLNEDRRVIHKLTDGIQKSIFGVEGIASTRFLYTVKVEKNGKALSEVYEADYDGFNARQITRNGGYCVTPCYIPSSPGKSPGAFFYVSYKMGQPKIFFASLQDGVGKRLSYLGGNQFMPTMSRQRDQVAFISDVTGNPDLFILPYTPETGPLGKPRKIYTAPQGTQGTPTFSPDGKKIAFVSNKDGSPRIYILNIPPPGTSLKDIKPQLISRACRESTAPQWSPDGTKIAFCATINGVRQIWIYDVLKKTETQLTVGPGNKENPTWGKNSLHLIFNSTGANNSELYLVNLKQPKAVKISSGPGEKHFPNFF